MRLGTIILRLLLIYASYQFLDRIVCRARVILAFLLQSLMRVSCNQEMNSWIYIYTYIFFFFEPGQKFQLVESVILGSDGCECLNALAHYVVVEFVMFLENYSTDFCWHFKVTFGEFQVRRT